VAVHGVRHFAELIDDLRLEFREQMSIFREVERLGFSLERFMPLLKTEWVRALPR